MVFIGAFFLLNLTLAVIQSSYSETQTRMKAEKARLKLLQEEMSMAAQTDTKELEQVDENAAAQKANLGVMQFYIAKRAAVKLKLFWK